MLGIFKKVIRKVDGHVTTMIRKIRKSINMKVTYRYAGFSIGLPADHLLPTYRSAHRLYDQFVPHLAQHLSAGDVVVDVGANCGDTLAAMCEANATLKYICIEPDEEFFAFLVENITKISSIHTGTDIVSVKSLVGKGVSDIVLVGQGGTKRATKLNGKSGIKSRTLDDILAGLQTQSVRLIKSDVDGFDYDVISSSDKCIGECSPILFFECQLDNTFQRDGYLTLIYSIHKQKHYSNFAIFDNFGELIVVTRDIDAVKHLIEYLWRQHIGRTTRTIFYYDILIFQDKDEEVISKTLKDYARF